MHGLSLADCFEDASPKRIDLLIGLHFYFNFIQGDVIHGKPKEPVALRSKLGWIVSGSLRNESSNSNSFSSTHLILEGFDRAASETFQENEIVSTLKEFWQHEACGLFDINGKESTERTTPSCPQRDFVNIVHNGERYEANLPFSSNPQGLLPSNYTLCSSCLNSLIKKLRANPSLLAEYDTIIREQLETGIIERVDKDAEQQENCHFLSHHCVLRQDHDTTKVRIVFDGSARESKHTPSINDVLALEENFMPHLFDTIIRFRSHTIGLTGDLQKAFHQISINESDRDYLRFLWVDNVAKLEPAVVQLRFCRLPFGLKPSPSILGATLNKHASLFENTESHISQIIKNMYADDLSCGADSANAVLEIMHKAKAIMRQAGFNLCKFKSNDPEVRSEIAKLEVATKDCEVKQHVEDSEIFTRSTIGLPYQEGESNTKVLGINWDTNSDRFFFELSKVIEFAASLPPTKRSLLKIAAKIFDPLGCLIVYTINLKILFQQLCFSKLFWHEELKGETRVHYDKLLHDMDVLQGAYIPRSLFLKGKGVSSVQIHAFSDASEKAYATVVYLRILYDSGEVDVQLIAAKAKVSPLKKHSIPRLELIGATLMAKFVTTIRRNLQKELGYEAPISIYLWVDSMVTLCWIVNCQQWTQFVRRRVDQILEFSSREDWYFCPGSLNPADLPSRGKFHSISNNNSLWWKGPAILKSPPSEWPAVDRGKVIETSAAYSEEIKSPIQVTHAMVNMQDEIRSVTNIIELQRFSSKRRLVRTVAWVLRFVHNVKSAVSSKDINIEKELNVEIEGVVNSRPLTYVFNDTESVSFPLTPSHLLNGRNLLQEPSDRFAEIITTYETLPKRAKYHFRLLWDFSKRWNGEYLYCLMEAYRSKQTPTPPSISVGDLVILGNENTKRSFWKVCRVEELLKDRDGNIRTAKIIVPTDKGNVQFIRPLKYLVPIEVSSKQSINSEAFAKRFAAPARTAKSQTSASEAQKTPLNRPRRNAAVVGELVRRDTSS